MEQFSPLTRRFLAIALLLLAVLVLLQVIILPVASGLQQSLSGLKDSRFERARLEALAARPVLDRRAPVDPAMLIRATTRDQAAQLLVGRLSQIIVAAGPLLRTETLTAEAVASPQIASASVKLVGPETAVTRFIASAEGGRPLVRFRDWRLEPVSDQPGQVRFSARVMSVWTPR